LSEFHALQLNNQRKRKQTSLTNVQAISIALRALLIPSLVQLRWRMVPIRSRRRAVKQNAASMLRRTSRNC
jgi:hypothetical protein